MQSILLNKRARLVLISVILVSLGVVACNMPSEVEVDMDGRSSSSSRRKSPRWNSATSWPP